MTTYQALVLMISFATLVVLMNRKK
ncbi:putative holin-like toxin [Tuberibacillus sp. Marseille-P3662]